MKVAIHQPNYFPYLGVYDKVDQADVFIFLDTVQFTSGEWQNRNRIKTANGVQWITVPVIKRFGQKIKEVKINSAIRWGKKHRQSLITNYMKAPYFEDLFYKDGMKFFFECNWPSLVSLNVNTSCFIIQMIFSLKTELLVASEMNVGDFDNPDDRIISLVKEVGGNTYISGANGINYMDLKKYEKAGIEVEFQKFTCPEYSQLYGEFEPNLSILDILFNHGKDGMKIIRSSRK